jgi:hypothetical protein
MPKHLFLKKKGGLTGAEPAAFPFPVSDIRPIPIHGLQRLYMAAAVGYYSVLDRFF